MALIGGKPSDYDSYIEDSRYPNPRKFKIKECEKVGDYYISLVNCPGCTSYEGDKILVTTKPIDKENNNQGNPYALHHHELDPHFLKNIHTV